MSITVKPANKNRPVVVVWYVNRKKHEKGFPDTPEGRRAARKFDVEQQRAALYGDRAGEAAAAKGSFGAACAAYIDQHPRFADQTRRAYRQVLRKHIAPAIGTRTAGQLAGDRGAVLELLASVDHLGYASRLNIRSVIVGTLDDLQQRGVISAHRCSKIPLAPDTRTDTESFDPARFPTLAQVAIIADGAMGERGHRIKGLGVTAWLMRLAGLRIKEALAVEKGDFFTRNGERLLQVRRQTTRDGRKAIPLKHRSGGEYREVPVPDFLWDLVQGMPDGVLTPGTYGGRPYRPYMSALGNFRKSADKAGVDKSVHPHTLRHQYASVLLEAREPVSNVSKWLGHRNVQETVDTYAKVMPGAPRRAADVLQSQIDAWKRSR